MKKNILFVCKYNRFRSKIAEAAFRKFNKNKNFKAKSAGMIRGFPISKDIIEEAKNNGLKVIGKPQGISVDLLKQSNLVVIVADDVPREIFPKKYVENLIVWKIRDVNNDKETINSIIQLIEKNVIELIKKLK